MSSAWLLPEHIADVLPAQARHIESLRRDLIDVVRSYGCELVMPPLLEHVESLLSGTSHALDLRTFKLVDQLSGRMLGLRSDCTLQVARMDAHLLNRSGIARLCYCGPVLHALPEGLQSTREPLQFGAEIYGHAGIEADLEIVDMALDCLRRAGLGGITLDLSDARIVRGVLGDVMVGAEQLDDVYASLALKDSSHLRELSRNFPGEVQRALQALLVLYGGTKVVAAAREILPQRPLVQLALDELQSLARRVEQAHPEVEVGFDLADIGGNGYYSGMRFAVFAVGHPNGVVRGGRYDEVGAAFGRNRTAVGFSLDLKSLAGLAPSKPLQSAIRAPWAEDGALRAKVRALRELGETVVRVLPGHDNEVQAFACDRELVMVNFEWVVRAL